MRVNLMLWPARLHTYTYIPRPHSACMAQGAGALCMARRVMGLGGALAKKGLHWSWARNSALKCVPSINYDSPGHVCEYIRSFMLTFTHMTRLQGYRLVHNLIVNIQGYTFTWHWLVTSFTAFHFVTENLYNTPFPPIAQSPCQC